MFCFVFYRQLFLLRTTLFPLYQMGFDRGSRTLGMLLEVSRTLAQNDTIGGIRNRPKFNHLRFFGAFYKNLKYR